MGKSLNVAVLFGGCSSEYSVSLQSAYSVITHIDRQRYTPVLIGITANGQWFHYEGDVDKIPVNQWYDPRCCAPALLSPSRGDRALLVLREDQVERISIDVAFPVLHGKNGEDGTVQGLIELAGIPLAGCGTLSSALCMDKDRAHKLVALAGIAVPASAVLHRGALPEDAAAQADKLGYPLFVKPVRAASSYGITKVSSPSQLPAAVELAFQHDSEVILEEAISGFEVGCAVLGNDVLTVGEPDEIELSGDFFDFTEKYTLKTSAIHVPARISPAARDAIREASQVIYRALDCRGFARVDLFLDANGRLVFNEVNTIPGFTSHSRYPNMLKAVGMPFEQVVNTAIALALEDGTGAARCVHGLS